jgi:putative restriction endonuclease
VQVALDAAHIKWHQAGGPDVEPNGIALCVLHHKLFDRGGFTIEDDLRVLLSADLHGDRGFEEHLLPFHGRTVRLPSDPGHRPAVEHLGWHRREVFHGPGRYVEAER